MDWDKLSEWRALAKKYPDNVASKIIMELIADNISQQDVIASLQRRLTRLTQLKLQKLRKETKIDFEHNLQEDSQMPYGAHKGDRMEYVSSDYLLFLWDNGLWDGDTLFIDAHFAPYPTRATAERRLAVHHYIRKRLTGIESDAKKKAKHQPKLDD